MEQETKKSGSKAAMWNSWSSWTSPVGLGLFLLTASLALAIFLYSILSLVGGILQVIHPASADALSQQEMQQEMEQMPATSGDTGAPATPAAQ